MPMLKTTRASSRVTRHALTSSVSPVANEDPIAAGLKPSERASPEVDADLDRLVALSRDGHNGVNLADLSREERRQHLMGNASR